MTGFHRTMLRIPLLHGHHVEVDAHAGEPTTDPYRREPHVDVTLVGPRGGRSSYVRLYHHEANKLRQLAYAVLHRQHNPHLLQLNGDDHAGGWERSVRDPWGDELALFLNVLPGRPVHGGVILRGSRGGHRGSYLATPEQLADLCAATWIALQQVRS